MSITNMDILTEHGIDLPEDESVENDELIELLKIFVSDKSCEVRTEGIMAAVTRSTEISTEISEKLGEFVAKTNDQETRLTIVEKDLKKDKKNLSQRANRRLVIYGIVLTGIYTIISKIDAIAAIFK